MQAHTLHNQHNGEATFLFKLYNIQDSNNQLQRLGSAYRDTGTWHHVAKYMDLQLLLHILLFSCTMCSEECAQDHRKAFLIYTPRLYNCEKCTMLHFVLGPTVQPGPPQKTVLLRSEFRHALASFTITTMLTCSLPCQSMQKKLRGLEYIHMFWEMSKQAQTDQKGNTLQTLNNF